MSNEAHQIGRLTGANANILSVLGDILSSDGVQALRIPLGTPGQFLGVDLTAETGLAWQTPGGGGSLTFSDGVTRSADNVTNDLVTGTPVAEVDARVNFSNESSLFQMNGTDAGVFLRSGDDGAGRGDMTLHGGTMVLTGDNSFTASGEAGNATLTNSTADRVRIRGTGGVEAITAGGAGRDITLNATNVSLQLSGGGASANKIIATATGSGTNGVVVVTGTSAVQINSGAGGGGISLTTGSGGAGDITLTSDLGIVGTAVGLIQLVAGLTAELSATTALGLNAGTDMTLTTAGTGDILVNPSRDETHTVGRNLTVTAAGAAGSSISALNGNLTLDAGPTGGTGEVRLMPTGGVPAATRTFRIWNGDGAGQQPYVEAAGGAVIDAEARAAIQDISDALAAWGWFAPPA